MSILDTFLEGREDELSGMTELGAVPLDYVNDYLEAESDLKESRADSAIRSKSEQLLDAFLSSDYKAPSFSQAEEGDREVPDADDDTEHSALAQTAADVACIEQSFNCEIAVFTERACKARDYLVLALTAQRAYGRK